MIRSAWEAYGLRLRRKRFLLRAWRKSRELTRDTYRADQIDPSDILCFVTLRNEAERLPFFLAHYRGLGVAHFLVVDNGSDDGSADLLRDEPDVSLWRTTDSYKAARFGIDWLTALQWKFGHGHWCLTVDADEVLIYPDWDSRGLPALTGWLDRQGIASFGAMMLDMYPKGPLSRHSHVPGQDPTDVLGWFDAGPYRRRRNPRFDSDWIQGGVRDRMFFAAQPDRAPTLNKVPLVKWQRGFAYVTSTHHMLPRRLNRVFETQVAGRPSGILLHTKFLPSAGQRAAEELTRREHFENADLYDAYYRQLIDGVDLWHEESTRYAGWQQLLDLGLMVRGAWPS